MAARSRRRAAPAVRRAGSPSAVAAVVTVVALVIALAGCAAASPAPAAFSQPASCAVGIPVSTAGELSDALADAEPGQVIVLGDGRYEGSFTLAASGSADEPLTICGGAGAVLDGGSTDRGYTLHLDGADHVRLEGFTVTGGQKGVMLDASSGNTLSALTVTSTGDEAVHLRDGSSDNLLENLTVSRTGLRTPEFGEGVYIGTAESNWCTVSACAPDASDRNRVVGATISETTAEAIDVKEGTTGGELSGNRLDGAGTTSADSLIDVKGNDWVVTGTVGQSAPGDGAQVHVILDGWGSGNTFSGNAFAIAADGYAVRLEGAARTAGNVVGCDNVATVDGKEVALAAYLSNVPCTR